MNEFEVIYKLWMDIVELEKENKFLRRVIVGLVILLILMVWFW